MDLMSRAVQERILRELSEVYPECADRGFLEDIPERTVIYNLAYLHDHGLLDCEWTQAISEPKEPYSISINARGIDFITDDGGLSAILGTVTIKFHQDTFKALLIQKIENAPGDDASKAGLIAQIKAMPSEALSTIAHRALETGLDQVPNLIHALRGWIGL